MAGNEYYPTRPHAPQDTRKIAAGSPLAVLGLLLESVRQRFAEDANLGIVWREDPATTDVLIELGYNVEHEGGTFVRGVFINRLASTPMPIAVGNSAGVHLPDHKEGYIAMMSMPISIDCVAADAGESMLLGDIVQHFIMASSDILERMYGLHDVDLPALSATNPYTHDQKKFSTTVTFTVQYPVRWSTVKIRPLLAQIAMQVADAETGLDAAGHFVERAQASLQRRWPLDPPQGHPGFVDCDAPPGPGTGTPDVSGTGSASSSAGALALPGPPGPEGPQGLPGPQGPPGITYPPDGVLVYTSADLPAPQVGVITGTPNTIYRLMGVVPLPAGVRLVLSATNCLVGTYAGACQLVGDVDAPLVTISGAGASAARIHGVSIINNNAGASAVAMRVNEPTVTLDAAHVSLHGYARALVLDAASSVSLHTCRFSSTHATNACIQINSSGYTIIETCRTAPTGATASHIELAAGGTVSYVSISHLFFEMATVTQVGLLYSGATINRRVELYQVERLGAAGVVNSGWDQGTPRFHTTAVETLPDSTLVGASDTTTPFVVPISSNAYTPLQPAVGTPWALDADSERFSLVSAATGQLQFLDTENRRVVVNGSATLEKTGTVVGTRIAVYVNGALHLPSVAYSEVGNRPVTLVCPTSVHVATPGMTFELRVLNEDNLDDYTVQNAELSVFGANIN